MKQSKFMSMLETVLSTAIGFVVALTAQILVFPLFGFNPPLSHNLLIGAIFTVVSIARGFLVRRLFEALHIRTPLSPFMQAVIAERRRQVEQEGWDARHDDTEHLPGELARAGASYALHAHEHLGGEGAQQSRRQPDEWPWARHWWKPTDFRRDLVKAGALIVAEGERHDRQKRRGAPVEPTSEQLGSVA